MAKTIQEAIRTLFPEAMEVQYEIANVNYKEVSDLLSTHNDLIIHLTIRDGVGYYITINQFKMGTKRHYTARLWIDIYPIYWKRMLVNNGLKMLYNMEAGKDGFTGVPMEDRIVIKNIISLAYKAQKIIEPMIGSIAYEMWSMITKYCPKYETFRQYNLRKDVTIHVDFHEINTMIQNLKPKQAIIVRFYDYADTNFKEDAYVVIKSYTHFTKRRFSMKVFYTNSQEKKIHSMVIECLGHSYELKYNDETAKCGMRWSIRNAIENTLHMCYTHIYDFCMLPTVIIDDRVVSNTLNIVDKFIDQAIANYDSPRSQKFIPVTKPNSSITVNLRPSCANIIIKENGKELIDYPLFPIGFRSRMQVNSTSKLAHRIMVMAYTNGLYRRIKQTNFTLLNLIPSINGECYVLHSNPEMEEVTPDDYTAETLSMKFAKRLQEIPPFISNLFRFEYAFQMYDSKLSVRYTLGIGIVVFKDFIAIYAYETSGHTKVSTYGKIITRNSNDDEFAFIRECRLPNCSGISTKIIVDKVSESVREWM